MPQDNRYTVVRILIEVGQIKIFKQIFDYIPISVVAIDYGSKYVRFKRQITRPNSFKLRDINIQASLFEIDFMKMIELILNQHKNTNPQ
jgi:hypothetical protein